MLQAMLSVCMAKLADARRLADVAAGSSVDTAGRGAPVEIAMAVACWQALDHQARSLRAEGDERSIRDLMCDLFVERLTGQTNATDLNLEIALSSRHRRSWERTTSPPSSPTDHPVRDLPGRIVETIDDDAEGVRWTTPTGHSYTSKPPPVLGLGNTRRVVPRGGPQARANTVGLLLFLLWLWPRRFRRRRSEE
jgi:hypothetical protein